VEFIVEFQIYNNCFDYFISRDLKHILLLTDKFFAYYFPQKVYFAVDSNGMAHFHVMTSFFQVTIGMPYINLSVQAKLAEETLGSF